MAHVNAASSRLKANNLETSDLARGISLESTISAICQRQKGSIRKKSIEVMEVSETARTLEDSKALSAVLKVVWKKMMIQRATSQIQNISKSSEASSPDSHDIRCLTIEHCQQATIDP